MTATLSVPTVFARPELCPDCWSPLQGTSCPRCRLQLDGPDAQHLLHVSTVVDAWLERRARGLAGLRGVTVPALPAPEAAPRLDGVPVVYGRVDLCPQCWSPLTGPGCSACGLDLNGPQAFDVHEAGRQLDGWLAVRSDLIRHLRTPQAHHSSFARPQDPTGPLPQAPAAAQPHPTPQAQDSIDSAAQNTVQRQHPVLPSPAAEAFVAPVPPVPDRPAGVADNRAARQGPPPTVPRSGPPWWARWKPTPQAVLLGLGALLVAVAAVIFLLLTWDRLGIEGRSLVLAGATVLTTGLAVATRRRLPATAETMGALSVVLFALDVVALRATDLLARDVSWSSYLAVACTLLAALYLLLARFAGLRAFGYGAAVLAPLSPLLIGNAVGQWAGASDVLVLSQSLGALTALLVGALGLRRRESVGWAGVLAYAVGLTLQLVTVTALVVLLTDLSLNGLLWAVVALTGVGHTLLVGTARTTLSAVVGVAGALALALPVVDRVDTWWVLVVPMLVGAYALGLTVVGGDRERGLRSGPASLAALVVLGVWVIPGLALTYLRSMSVFSAISQAYGHGLDARWSAVAGENGAVSQNLGVAALGACLVACLVLLAWHRLTGTGTHGAALISLGTTALALPWWHTLPIYAVVLIGLVTCVTVVAGTRLVPDLPGLGAPVRDALQALAFVLSVLVVIAAWTVEPLAVPVTVLGIAGLVFWWSRTRNPLLWIPTLVAVYAVALGLAVSADLLVSQTGFAVLWASLAVLSLVLVLPRHRLGATDRQVLSLGAAIPGALALLVQGWILIFEDVPDGPMLMTWTSALALACSTAISVDPGRRLPSAARVSAVPVAVFWALALALSVNSWFGWSDEAVAAAVAVLAATVLHGWCTGRVAQSAEASAGPRVVALEWSLLAAAVAAACLIPLQDHPWLSLTLLGAAAGLVSLAPRRRPVAWASWALLTAAWWSLLAETTVRTVEAFSLPPAVLLLAAGAWAMTSESRSGRVRVLRPSLAVGTGLLVLPSAADAVLGTSLRAVVVLVLGAVLAGTVVVLRGRPQRVWQELGLVLAPTVALALTMPWLHGVLGLPAGPVNDLLIAGSAGALGCMGLVSVRGAGRWPWPPFAAATAAAALVVLPLILTGHNGTATQLLWRSWLSLAASGALLLAAQIVPARGVVRTRWLVAAGGLLALSAGGGAIGQLMLPAGHPMELVTVPASLLVLALGALRMRSAAESSWRLVGPALLAALVPSLLTSLGGGSDWRLIYLTVGCAAAVVAGIRLGWQAPILVGGGLLVVHGVAQLAPWFALAYTLIPRWAYLAAVGTVLLVLGARYEQRMADVRNVRRHLSELR